MQLDVAVQLPRFRTALGQLRDVAADEPDAFAQRLPRARDLVEIRVRQRADRELAADRAALFVLPHHDVERMAQPHALLAERSRDLDRAEGADRPVEVAAVGDRVDVRADEDRRQRRARVPSTRREDVAGRVDARRRARPRGRGRA